MSIRAYVLFIVGNNNFGLDMGNDFNYILLKHLFYVVFCILFSIFVYVQADNSVPCPPEDWTNPHPEQGFKGTGLLSS